MFFHERTSILSIYHDRTGLIVGGGNDRTPQYAAFSCGEEDWIYYCSPRGGSATVGRGVDMLSLDYGAADLRLSAKVVSDTELTLEVETDLRERRDECFLNLQLPLERVGEVTLGTGKVVKLSPKRKLKHHRAGGALNAEGWRIEAPEDSLFVWPHRPYLPYPRKAEVPPVGFLRIPLDPVRSSCKVRITVKY